MKRLAIWPLAALVLIALPFVFDSGTSLTKMSLMCIMAVFALSYNMLLGQTGMLSFGHAVYYGLAGFMSIHALQILAGPNASLPLVMVPIVGAFTGLLFAFVFGWVSTKRAGTAFAMISLGLGELVAASSLIMRSFFGGEEGVSADRSKLALWLGLDFGAQIQVYYLIAAWTFVSVITMFAITQTPFGRMANAVRENPERAEFIGYSTQMIRFISFCLSGIFAGIAGALAAINFEIMNALSVSGAQSGAVLLMTYIGGVGHFLGPILGAMLITALQISLSDYTGAWMLYFGLMFILVVMYLPGGIAGLIMMHEPVFRAGLLHRLIPAYLMVSAPALIWLAGAVAIIELAHHALVKAATEGPQLVLIGLEFSSRTMFPWTIA
ncbi:MAG: branched-chain amino acid ABC transporter permease, partial [Betaproteobacteria bacterium]|nr:branched-chain amino acid ABC transporter permease [Betaproteobacteria bacterium]